MNSFTVLVLVSWLAFTAARHAVKREFDSDSELGGLGDLGELGELGELGDLGEPDELSELSELGDLEDDKQCGKLLRPCFMELYPYISAEDTAEMLRSIPIREQCRVITSVRDCFRRAKKSQSCRSQFTKQEWIDQFIRFMSGVIKFVCEDRLDDFEEHENCFRSAKFDQDVEECRSENFEGSQCNPDRFVACTNRALDATPSCDAGAKDLARDFIHETISLVPECEVPGLKMLTKLHMKLFK
jgi:hypothetical protein